MQVAFAFAKATHIFSAKILAYMPYLVLNNWAQYFWVKKSTLSGDMIPSINLYQIICNL